MTGVTLSLLNSDGSAAPNWAVLNGDGEVDDLAVGDTHEASVTFAPGDGISEGIYHLILCVTSDNYAQTDINLYASRLPRVASATCCLRSPTSTLPLLIRAIAGTIPKATGSDLTVRIA